MIASGAFYWLVNIPDRQREVYAAGENESVILGENDAVVFVIAGHVVGRIPVTDLLPEA
jgi:hypothetical protein